MAHIPHTWNNGDIVSAAILNALETDLAAAADAAALGTAADADITDFDPAGAAATAQAAAIQRANHTGTQTADTITDGITNKAYTAAEKTKLAGIAPGATANRTDAATDTAIADAVAGVINGAPGALDTLKELADALGDDANYAATITTALAGKATPAQITAAITALNLGTASTHAATDFDGAGAANSAQGYAIQRANHTGTQPSSTVTGLDVALARGGAVLYVALDGDDSATGTSWSSAKRTVAAAAAALPTYTSLGVTYHAGTVKIGDGLFVEQGNIEANAEIRFVGANAMSGQRGTWIQLAAGRNCDVFTYTPAWGTEQNFAHGLAFENLTVDGNASAQGATTLSAAITTTTATSLTVTANTTFPQSGTFDVAIDSEIVTVTAGAGTNTWTVTRGQYGTVAATHASGAAVNYAGSCVRIFGGGFNCKTDNTHFRNAGIGMRVDGAAVNYVGHDFHASNMYGPAFAYLPASWASGCMIAFTGTGQIDDCGRDPMFFQGSQNGTLVVSIGAMKFEANVSTTKHQHCIAYKSALDSGSSPSFVIDGVTAYANGGGREAVIYDYAGTNGQGAAWDLHAIVGVDGYTEAFYSARYGIHSGTQGISSLALANSDNSGGGPVLGSVHLGTATFYSSPYAATPNGQVTAYQGSLYAYTGAGAPTLWTKTTNSGNTGWVPFQAVASGATASRTSGVPAGWSYFDTTLGRPVWYNGSAYIDPIPTHASDIGAQPAGDYATNTSVATETTRAQNAEALLAPKASPTFTGTVSGITAAMVGADPAGSAAAITPTSLGLGNVTNTSDANKPVSTAQAAAIAAAQAQVVGVNTQTASYTTVLADAGQLLVANSASAVTFTIPTNATVAYPVGTVIGLANINTGALTITAAAGATVNSPAGLRITTQYGQGSLVKIATDTWLLSGQTVT